ncbi:MAG TPA: helix-turn-helix domain-containing protein [Chloroflexota bacterium]|nr:helix-turn-helix domain-containing protein [Chloroflexota bacterium]
MNLEGVVDQLSRLGFSQPEARAYLALLGKSPATGYEVAKNSGLSRGQIYETLGRLESAGAVQRTLDGKYLAVPFREFAHDKLATVREAIKEVEQALPQLSDTRGEAALIVYGYANLVLRALEIVHGATRNVFLACFPPELEKLADELIAAKERGVDVNVLCYGDCELPGLDVVQHHGIFVVRTGNGGRSFHLVADRHASMMGVVREIEEDTSALWSRNEYFCTSVMKYVAADMSILRIFEALPRSELTRLKRQLNTTADRIGMVGVPGIVDDPMELIDYWRAS